jgi:hypothetical protein
MRKYASSANRASGKWPIALRSGELLVSENPDVWIEDDPDELPKEYVGMKGLDMKNAGRRLPQGGAPGDTYSHYSWMAGDSSEERDRIFAYIHVRVDLLFSFIA